jgi:altronate dehydratase
MKLAIRIHPEDNVATAIEPLAAGEELVILSDRGEEVDRLKATTDIPLEYHKVALTSIPKGAEVLKYGEIIGHATASIARGQWMHTHNIESAHYPGTGEGEAQS